MARKRKKNVCSIKSCYFISILGSQASSAEQAWRRMYSKVEMITAIPKTMVKRHKRQVKEYHSELDALPQLNADLIGKVDFFTKFLDDNNVKTDDFRNEVDKLTR